METKGRPKVTSLQESTNTCMQWAVLGPPGDERRQTGEVIEMEDVADGCSTLFRTISQRGSQPPTLGFCGFSERVLKDNPIFSLTAPTPLLVLCLERKKIWIFSTQHAGILFLNPYYPWWKSPRLWISQKREHSKKKKTAPKGRL